MADLKRTELELRAERAVLVQVASSRDRLEADVTFAELENLAHTAGARAVGQIRQLRNLPDRRFYVGKGKLEELRGLCQSSGADVVICDDELSPSQVRTLEEELDVKVVDRSEVILDIFAAHARTKQSQVQVELAQLEYEFPRLKRMWTHLDRTAGGTLGGPVGGGIGVRGPGEKQLEADRRIVQRRIHDLRQELEDMRRRRHVEAQSRNERFPSVALVGYTNAGKSSLMNALTDAGVRVRDRLFETLDTRTRVWNLPDGHKTVLSDTVGFIRKFPHHLADSFHATLEEASEADLLLHVVDASQPDCEREMEAVNSVLDEIGSLTKPTICVLNKMDAVREPSAVALLRRQVGELVCTSAVTGDGLDELARRVEGRLAAAEQEMFVAAAAGNGRLFAFLHTNGRVLDQRSDGDTLRLTVRMHPRYADAIRELGGKLAAPPAEAGAQ
jgi:GTP-binding protein HflX